MAMRGRAAGAKWPTVAVLAILLAATVLDWPFVWGALFLYWALDGIRSGEAYIIQRISRVEAPGLFWAISVFWLVLAALTIYIDASERWFADYALA